MNLEKIKTKLKRWDPVKKKINKITVKQKLKNLFQEIVILHPHFLKDLRNHPFNKIRYRDIRMI